MITEKEIELARYCISTALKHGADAARASLSMNMTDSCTMLNAELDKVSHSADCSIYMYLYVDGRYGTFSTNRLVKEELEDFIGRAVTMVRMLGKDEYRKLPDPERTAKDASDGKELGLYDPAYETVSAEDRLDRAASLSIFGKVKDEDGWKVVSQECEYSDSEDDNYIIDSQGFEGRQTETTFSCFSEITIEDRLGNKYSGYWWDSSPESRTLSYAECGREALKRAVSQIGPKEHRSGKYRMVVDTNVASRLISPVISALNASSIQQKMSFLEDSIGKKVFPEGLTLMDMARSFGKAGARLFDSEGVATKDSPIIKEGVVMQYFVNTYMAGKMGLEPTVEDISRPCILPYMKGSDSSCQKKALSLEDILLFCDSGIYVTGFNGGNCNPVTGDFSFGIEGFAFSRGKVTYPVREMLITGNMLDLWEGLVAAGADSRSGVRWQIPTLAFEGVSFSA